MVREKCSTVAGTEWRCPDQSLRAGSAFTPHDVELISRGGTNELATATETVRADLSNGAQHHGSGKDNFEAHFGKGEQKSREEELSKLNGDDLLLTGWIAMRKQDDDDDEHDDSWLANSHGVTLCLQM